MPTAGQTLPNLRPTQCVGEMGVYGTVIVRQTASEEDAPLELLENSVAGYLLRTKPLGTDEGGVAAGFAVVDTIALVD